MECRANGDDVSGRAVVLVGEEAAAVEAALDPGLSHWSRTAAKMNAMSGNTLPTWYFAEFEPVGVAQTLQQLRVPGRIGTGRLREHALLYAPTGCRPKARRRMRLTLEPSRNSKLDSAVRGPRPRPPGKGAPRQPGLVHSSVPSVSTAVH